jgi:hypothetical protein
MSKSKDAVYDAIEKLAKSHGVSTDNPANDKYPVSDTLDHFGLNTPEDYRIMGDITVVQSGDNNISLRATGQNRDLEQLAQMQGKIAAALTASGMKSVEQENPSFSRTGYVGGDMPAGADKDAMREKIADALEKQLGKPGAEVGNPEGKAVGANVAMTKAR